MIKYMAISFMQHQQSDYFLMIAKKIQQPAFTILMDCKFQTSQPNAMY